MSGVVAPGAAEALVQQLTMLVTAEGQWALPESEEFFTALGDLGPDYDAVGFAVRNLGFIKFQVLDRLVTEIELHPRNVDLRALLALERLLEESPTNLFRIRYLDSEWHSEISSSVEHTLARLRELCAPAFSPAPSERFNAHPQSPSVLSDRSPELGQMAMKWRVAFGNFDDSVLQLASRNDLLSMMAIVGFEGIEGNPVWRFLGDGHRWAARQYQVNGLGEKVENIPDHEYGHWAAEFHRAVASSGQPRYDRITAATEYHPEGEPDRQTRRVINYERLLLPWRTPSGEVLITSCARKVGLNRERSANLAPEVPESSVAK
jgi:hypothetical protein